MGVPTLDPNPCSVCYPFSRTTMLPTAWAPDSYPPTHRSDYVVSYLHAQCYLLDNCTDFSTTRFDLSSFSKVCTHVRWPTERVLYQDIHVHLDGWSGVNTAHPEWRGGSLRLLLRTLEGRIDLRACVRSVQMDWYNEEMCKWDSTPFEDAFRQFFARCTSVRRLNMMTFPSELFSEIAPFSQITSMVTSVPSLDMFRTVVKTFPVLEDLYLAIDCPIDNLPSTHVSHQLKKLRIESIKIDVPSVFWALKVCAHITEELHMNSSGHYQGGRPQQSPALIPISPSAGTNLRSLWLAGEELNFLAHPNSSLAQAFRQLPSLQHLHLSKCLGFHPTAFSVLPVSLRCLFLYQYGDWVNNRHSRHLFVAALSECLAQARRVVKMVTIHDLTRKALEDNVLGDLSPLQSVCNDRKIPFHLIIGSESDWMSGEIRILFA